MTEICIVKLGADGDVLRTLPLAGAIKRQKNNARITWITRGDVADIVRLCPYVDEVKQIPYFDAKEFDEIYNFDVDKEALRLIDTIKARAKFGFHAVDGFPAAYSAGGEYYLNTMFDDELKRSNKRTYQDMMFDAAGLRKETERIVIKLDEQARAYAERFKQANKLGKRIIGIHMGASSRWPSKAWHKERVEQFISKAGKEYSILLFGGPNEATKQAPLVENLRRKGIAVATNNPNNTKTEFLSLLSLCDYVVCADSFALHAAIGLGKRTVALFFCTSPDEVEGYGMLKKLVAERLHEFFPERSDQYDEELTRSISEDKVLESIKEWEHKA